MVLPHVFIGKLDMQNSVGMLLSVAMGLFASRSDLEDGPKY